MKIQFDFYHVQIVSGDLITRFEKHLPLVGHVQIAAVPSRAEPDEGEINYPGVFAALDRLGWTGWTACEYKPRARTEAGLGWGSGLWDQIALKFRPRESQGLTALKWSYARRDFYVDCCHVGSNAPDRRSCRRQERASPRR